MVVKTFRGLLADGGQDQIRLQTIKGKVGYRIIKFQVIQATPGGANAENLVTISKTSFTPLGTVDFSDSNILGVAFYGASSSAQAYPATITIVFDNEIFNQDIFIGNKDVFGGGESMNYYIELEVIPLDDAGAEYTTLKDMRQS